MTPVQLPEVPESYGDHVVYDSVRAMREPGYTAAQLREYAIEAVMAERARMAAEVESLASEWSADEPDMADPPQFYFVRFKHQCAARIRALITPSETNSER